MNYSMIQRITVLLLFFIAIKANSQNYYQAIAYFKTGVTRNACLRWSSAERSTPPLGVEQGLVRQQKHQWNEFKTYILLLAYLALTGVSYSSWCWCFACSLCLLTTLNDVLLSAEHLQWQKSKAD